MQNNKHFLPISLTILTITLCWSLTFEELKENKEPVFYSIEELTTEGSITTKIIGIGGHTEDCVQFEITNTTSDTLRIQIEPGRRLFSEDTTVQDIFIVKEQLLVLNPKTNRKINGFGFCCQSHHAGPGTKTKFSVGEMAPTPWIELAEVINKNNFPSNAVQAAVWCMSNDHKISSIHDKNMEQVQLLRQTVARLKGIEIPWYSILYLKDSTQLFSNEPSKVVGDVDFYIGHNAVISILLKNKNGQTIKTLIKERAFGPGKYTYDLNLNVKNWPKESYQIYIYEDRSTLNSKHLFKL